MHGYVCVCVCVCVRACVCVFMGKCSTAIMQVVNNKKVSNTLLLSTIINILLH